MSTCIACNGRGMIGCTPYYPLVICSSCKGSGQKKDMIKIIVLKGKAGSGKTTIARYLEDNHGYVRLRFADGLKRMLLELGLTRREVDGDLKECSCEMLGGQTPRHAMVTLGTEWGRNMIHPDIWVKALDRDLKKWIEQKGAISFVIDDMRFLNEAEYIHSLRRCGITYKIVTVDVQRFLKSDNVTWIPTQYHVSETEMDKIVTDHTICNGGSLESLYLTLDEVVKWYFEKES